MTSPSQTTNAVDVAQAAELTGLSKKALRRRLERGTLDSMKVGSKRMIPISELANRGLLGEEPQDAALDGGTTRGPGGHTQPNGATERSEAPVSHRGEVAEPSPAQAPPPGPDEASQVPHLRPARDPEPAGSGTNPPTAAAQPEAAPETPTHAAPAPSVPPTEPAPVATPAPGQEAMPPGSMPGMSAPGIDPGAPAAAPSPGQGAPAQPGFQSATPAPAASGFAGSQGGWQAPEGVEPAVPPSPAGPGPYPSRGFWDAWYDYRALRLFAIVAVVALIALLVWLLLLRPDSSDSGANVRGGGPVAATESDLARVSQAVRQPVYWAGNRPGTHMELTQTDSGYAYVRYLIAGARVGDPSSDFLTVGTYPTIDAFHDLRSYARHTKAHEVPIQHGGIALTVPGSPTSVFFAYPHEDVQVEVYDPHPKRALQLVKTGVVRPVVGTAPGTAAPIQ